MKNGSKKIFLGIIIIALIGGLLVYSSKNKIDMNYGKIEYVQSIKEVKEGIPTIIMFRKPSCDECLEMERTFRRVYEESEGQINLVYYNVEEFGNNEVATALKNYDVKTVPTMIFIDKDGKSKFKEEGILSQEDVFKILKQL